MAGTQQEQIAASKQREITPNQWQLLLSDWSLRNLASLAADPVVHDKVRAYARWEIEFRLAFDKADLLEPPTPVNQKQGTFSERLEKHRMEAIEMTKANEPGVDR